MHINSLIQQLDKILSPNDFKDPSYNGLQVAGTTEIKKIATACTASLEAIDVARESGADALLVHHGLFWKGADPRLVGNYYERVQSLIKAKMNLIAYHLPLDAHLHYGNNAYIAKLLGGDNIDYVVPGDKTSIAMRTKLHDGLTVSEIAYILSKECRSRVQVLGPIPGDRMVDDVVVCSGSGSMFIDNNKTPDFQALITGDINEQTIHMARETGTIVFVIGHHASEQPAIHNLGAIIANKFELKHLPLQFDYELQADSYYYADEDDSKKKSKKK